MSQRHDLLNNHLARVPRTANKEGTVEMRDEVLSTVGAQYMDTSWFQVSDLEDVEFYWESDRLDVGAVFRPDGDEAFSPWNLNDFEMGLTAKTPILTYED